MPALLTTASRVTCAHGGQAMLLTPNVAVSARTSVLLESDVHLVVGCPFTVGPKYSPCVRIEWSAGSTSTSVNGTAPLTQASVGKCYGAEGSVQGVAIIASTQQQASAR